MVQNYMESQVREGLTRELNENPHKYTDLCRCPSCMATIQAVALNNLPPFYVTGVAGEVYGEYRNKDLQNYSDILVAIARGIEEVRLGNPHCQNAAARVAANV